MYRELHDHGFRVFGLHHVIDGQCQCGYEHCSPESAGKHPINSGWQHTPEWSEEQLDCMEEMGHFDTGYGVLVRGLLVIDIDDRNGGVESFEKLCAEVPEVGQLSGFIVQTGSSERSEHRYFTLPDDNTALVQGLKQYPGIDFKSSGYVVGPGSMHRSGREYRVVYGSPDEIQQAPPALLNLLRRPEHYRGDCDGMAMDVSVDDLRNILTHIPNQSEKDADYEKWIRVGMALHDTMQGDGFELWVEWSERNTAKHNQGSMKKKWASFGKAANPVTLGTLIHYAQEHGWKIPVKFSSDLQFHYEQQQQENTGDIDTKSVDLLRPPGFVGELAAWFNGRNRFPRERLSVAAALSTISAVAGMRYIDPLDGVTPNLFVFCVAGSATGKESVLKSYQELLRAAGLAPAVHGGIKSEQEIYRNLMRHQAAFYVIDEIGEHLNKINNARKNGTAAYLEGVIGCLMQVYSKANSCLLVTGDVKEEIRTKLKAEVAAINKQLDKEGNERDQKRLDNLVFQLSNIDNGLVNPFLSLMGFTTPEKFDSMMDFDMATNGFVGRSVIFRELEDNPRARDRKKIDRSEIPFKISGALQQMYAPGISELPPRVERVGDVVGIPTTGRAADMLQKIQDLFFDMAEEAKEQTGLTPIPRRGYEQVAKISMILAIPEGLRTEEHVRWAYALIKRDVEEKMKVARSNSAENPVDQMASRIMAMVSDEHGETIGRIRNNLRKYKREDIDIVVSKLVEAGHIHEREIPASRNGGRKTKKYFAKS